uniref:Uncharacterized protein n=1 Tax=Chromera velia CCMP2878 TaxID=1169474 RepID=A0A0G4GTC4_9ALVE|eukprot:Cvel_23302.t1-p1 / transcript=Cvel_23302.t1 / gene=Cvel_23302 / organism=Chromera_velia_CCMP2878 / gene_product=Leucine-rich repeat-containing protein 1, putative / transcript_product=Leucine-rich repeat-containing protein 1, putative / location=Cvel_scaffold2386:2588-9520(-) / protein_length=1866 / sequence_SO=supercontig / SO=protein_coding / is_pseudo=false
MGNKCTALAFLSAEPLDNDSEKSSNYSLHLQQAVPKIDTQRWWDKKEHEETLKDPSGKQKGQKGKKRRMRQKFQPSIFKATDDANAGNQSPLDSPPLIAENPDIRTSRSSNPLYQGAKRDKKKRPSRFESAAARGITVPPMLVLERYLEPTKVERSVGFQVIVEDGWFLSVTGQPLERSTQAAIKGVSARVLHASLRRCKLTEMPKELTFCPRLRSVDLSFNLIRDLPGDWQCHPVLQSFTADHNHLSRLSNAWITQMSSLREISISYNKLERLPTNIGQCLSLESIRVNGNLIQELPESLCELSGLRILDVEGNKLETLPEKFGELSSLEFLDVSKNNLRSLPESIGNCRRLESLRLVRNRVEVLPRTLLSLVDFSTGIPVRGDEDEKEEDEHRGRLKEFQVTFNPLVFPPVGAFERWGWREALRQMLIAQVLPPPQADPSAIAAKEREERGGLSAAPSEGAESEGGKAKSDKLLRRTTTGVNEYRGVLSTPDDLAVSDNFRDQKAAAFFSLSGADRERETTAETNVSIRDRGSPRAPLSMNTKSHAGRFRLLQHQQSALTDTKFHLQGGANPSTHRPLAVLDRDGRHFVSEAPQNSSLGQREWRGGGEERLKGTVWRCLDDEADDGMLQWMRKDDKEDEEKSSEDEGNHAKRFQRTLMLKGKDLGFASSLAATGKKQKESKQEQRTASEFYGILLTNANRPSLVASMKRLHGSKAAFADTGWRALEGGAVCERCGFSARPREHTRFCDSCGFCTGGCGLDGAVVGGRMESIDSAAGGSSGSGVVLARLGSPDGFGFGFEGGRGLENRRAGGGRGKVQGRGFEREPRPRGDEPARLPQTAGEGEDRGGISEEEEQGREVGEPLERPVPPTLAFALNPRGSDDGSRNSLQSLENGKQQRPQPSPRERGRAPPPISRFQRLTAQCCLLVAKARGEFFNLQEMFSRFRAKDKEREENAKGRNNKGRGSASAPPPVQGITSKNSISAAARMLRTVSFMQERHPAARDSLLSEREGNSARGRLCGRRSLRVQMTPEWSVASLCEWADTLGFPLDERDLCVVWGALLDAQNEGGGDFQGTDMGGRDGGGLGDSQEDSRVRLDAMAAFFMLHDLTAIDERPNGFDARNEMAVQQESVSPRRKAQEPPALPLSLTYLLWTPTDALEVFLFQQQTLAARTFECAEPDMFISPSAPGLPASSPFKATACPWDSLPPTSVSSSFPFELMEQHPEVLELRQMWTHWMEDEEGQVLSPSLKLDSHLNPIPPSVSHHLHGHPSHAHPAVIVLRDAGGNGESAVTPRAEDACPFSAAAAEEDAKRKGKRPVTFLTDLCPKVDEVEVPLSVLENSSSDADSASLGTISLEPVDACVWEEEGEGEGELGGHQEAERRRVVMEDPQGGKRQSEVFSSSSGEIDIVACLQGEESPPTEDRLRRWLSHLRTPFDDPYFRFLHFHTISERGKREREERRRVRRMEQSEKEMNDGGTLTPYKQPVSRLTVQQRRDLLIQRGKIETQTKVQIASYNREQKKKTARQATFRKKARKAQREGRTPITPRPSHPAEGPKTHTSSLFPLRVKLQEARRCLDRATYHRVLRGLLWCCKEALKHCPSEKLLLRQQQTAAGQQNPLSSPTRNMQGSPESASPNQILSFPLGGHGGEGGGLKGGWLDVSDACLRSALEDTRVNSRGADGFGRALLETVGFSLVDMSKWIWPRCLLDEAESPEEGAASRLRPRSPSSRASGGSSPSLSPCRSATASPHRPSRLSFEKSVRLRKSGAAPRTTRAQKKAIERFVDKWTSQDSPGREHGRLTRVIELLQIEQDASSVLAPSPTAEESKKKKGEKQNQFQTFPSRRQSRWMSRGEKDEESSGSSDNDFDLN